MTFKFTISQFGKTQYFMISTIKTFNSTKVAIHNRKFGILFSKICDFFTTKC